MRDMQIKTPTSYHSHPQEQPQLKTENIKYKRDEDQLSYAASGSSNVSTHLTVSYRVTHIYLFYDPAFPQPGIGPKEVNARVHTKT